MSRVARVVVPGFAHHVTQRGNRRADVFEAEEDYVAYLRFLRHYAQRRGLAVWAYCLMTNHVHLIVAPDREDSLGLALRDAHTVYAMRFNSRARLSGHVWQGRFYSCPMDEAHVWAAVRYAERNPVRAGMVERAEQYRWSSARAHCGHACEPVLSAEFPPPGVVNDWAAWLRDADDESTVDALRRQTRTGRPCGSPRFITQIESLLHRHLRPQPPGPKPKQTKPSPKKSTGARHEKRNRVR